MVLLDLNDFKRVDDTFGHGVGDDLLRDIAARLVSSLRAEDTVAQPVEIQEQMIHPSRSVGTSLCPADGLDFEPLMAQVDRRVNR